jgi:hypothetical protein
MIENNDNHIIIDVQAIRKRVRRENATNRQYNVNAETRAKALLSPRTGKRGKDIATLTREQALLNLQEKIIARTSKLANAQSMLGLGTIRVYRIDSHYEQFGKTKKLVKHKPVIVDNDDEITAILDHEYNGAGSPDTETQFYFVEVQEPNNTAIDSQLNRVFGKARESIDVTSNGNSIAPVIIGMRIIDNSIQAPQLQQEQSNDMSMIDSDVCTVEVVQDKIVSSVDT